MSEASSEPTWSPQKFTPHVSLAALRFEIVRRFRENAQSLDEEEEREKPVSIDTELTKIDDKIDPAHIRRFRPNPYGIVGKPFATPRLSTAVLTYAEKIYGRVLSAETSGAMSAMEYITDTGKPGTMEHLERFREYFTGFVSPLRTLPDNVITLQGLAIITHFDLWVSYLLTRVAREDPSKLSDPDVERTIAVMQAVASSTKLRDRAKTLKHLSPLTDLFDYQRLSNELDALCDLALIKDSKHAEDARAQLESKIEGDRFFERAQRFCTLFDWRIDEPLHALIIASVVNRDDQMERFGEYLLKASAQVVSFVTKEEDLPKITEEHPVIAFKEPVFHGGDAPGRLPQLEYYMKEIHPKVRKRFDLATLKKPRKQGMKP